VLSLNGSTPIKVKKRRKMSTEKLTTPIGDFEFVLDGYPTKETAQKLFDEQTWKPDDIVKI
jgi:hypothetical protein